MSDIKWYSSLPAHWEEQRTKYLFKIISGNGFPVEMQGRIGEKYPFAKAGTISSSQRYLKKANDSVSQDDVNANGFNVIPVGSIVMPKIGEALKKNSRAVTSEEVCIDNNCQAMVPQNIDTDFAFYLLSVIDMNWYDNKGTIPSVNNQSLKNDKVPYPPLAEQQAIVRLLDSKCSAIDEAIERHKKIIEKLEEYRGAEIARLVSFKTQNSTYETGNIWFPTLPNGVSVSRIGMHFDVTLGKMLCPKKRDDNDTLEKYYCAGDIHFDGINQDNLKEMWFSPNEKRIYEVFNDDLLIVEGGAGAGNAFIVQDQKNKVYIQNSVLRIRGSKTGSVRYLRYMIEHLVKNGYIAYACNTATFSHFTKDKVSGTPFPVASFELQEKIANQINSIDVTVRSAQKKHESVIGKLEEYRKSIIYNAVTGKIDCRGH